MSTPTLAPPPTQLLAGIIVSLCNMGSVAWGAQPSIKGSSGDYLRPSSPPARAITASTAPSTARSIGLDTPRSLDLDLRAPAVNVRMLPRDGDRGALAAPIEDSQVGERITHVFSLAPAPPADGKLQVLAARFRREGLPVARLWENHAALVSIGLNQKGKPGLWLIQKTH